MSKKGPRTARHEETLIRNVIIYAVVARVGVSVETRTPQSRALRRFQLIGFPPKVWASCPGVKVRRTPAAALPRLDRRRPAARGGRD